MPYIRHVHSSSRFDRSPRSLWRAFRFYVTMANFVSFTEVADGPRRETLRQRKGWGTAGAGDTAAAWKRRVWDLIDIEKIVLEDKLIKRNVICLRVLLDHRRAGKLVVAYVVHVPAHHDEANYRLSWEHSMNALALRLADDRAVYKNVILTGDWNKDYRLPKTRHSFAGYFPDTHVTWDKFIPQIGTFKRRLIDFTVSLTRITKARLLPDDRSSDHRPYFEKIEIV